MQLGVSKKSMIEESLNEFNTVKSQLSESRLSENTGLFEDGRQARLFLNYLLQ